MTDWGIFSKRIFQACMYNAGPGLKEFKKALASRFEARCDAQKGITSKKFDFGD